MRNRVMDVYWDNRKEYVWYFWTKDYTKSDNVVFGDLYEVKLTTYYIVMYLCDIK